MSSLSLLLIILFNILFLWPAFSAETNFIVDCLSHHKVLCFKSIRKLSQGYKLNCYEVFSAGDPAKSLVEYAWANTHRFQLPHVHTGIF